MFPQKLNNPEFKNAWNQWVAFRREIKKRLTPSTVTKQLAKLEAWGSIKAIQAIENSISNGWQGLFDPDKRAGKTSGSTEAETAWQTVRGIIKRIWSPDLRNHRDVETAIGNAELFAAAKLTGLSVIADAHVRDTDVERGFNGHLASLRARKATA